MTLCGLISHLRWVEHYWFHVMFLGEEDDGPIAAATRGVRSGDADRRRRAVAQLLDESRSRAPGTVFWSPSTTWTPGPSVPSATADTWTSAGSCSI